MKTNELQGKLASFFKGNRQIVAVYLFGSHALGRALAGSDIDIAILLKKGIGRSNAGDVAFKMTCQLMKFLKHDRIDILVLNTAGPIARHQVYLKGKLVFCRDKIQTLRYKDLSFSEYLDFLPFRQRAEKKMVDNIIRGAHG